MFSLFENEPPFIVSWSHYLRLMRIENGDESNIYASEYKLYLPDEKLSQQKLKEWIAEEGE